MTGPVKLGSLKQEILNKIGLMGRQRLCFDDDAAAAAAAAGDGKVVIPQGDWREKVPEEFRADKTLEQYKLGEGEELVPVPPGMIKSHINVQPLIGSKLVKPKEEASEEELDKFYAEIGMARPESPDKYEFTVDEKFKALPHSDTLEKWFRGEAHKLRIPQDKAAELYQGYQEQMLGMFTSAEEEMNKENTTATKALEDKWGAKTPENFTLADRAFHTLFPWGEEDVDPNTKQPTPEAKTKFLLRTLLGNNPYFIEAMYNLAPVFGEHLVKVGDEGAAAAAGAKTREELRKMQADPRYQTDKKYRQMVDDEYKKAFPGIVEAARTGIGGAASR